MFKRRKAKDAAAALPTSSPRLTPHLRNASASTTASTVAGPTSPSVMDFDFGLPSPLFGRDTARPSTSDGTPRQGSVSLAPPILPPIPRVASRREKEAEAAEQERGVLSRTKSDEEVVESPVSKISEAPSSASFDPGMDVSPFPRPMSSAAPRPNVEARPASAAGTPPPRMEPSMFPAKGPSTLPRLNTETPMSREWIDARDKPYSLPPPRPPMLQANHSSPDLLSTLRSQEAPRSPLSATRPAGPLQSHSTTNLLQRPPSNAPTNYSGTTARSIFSSKTPTINTDLPTPTVGTPYQEMSPTFPLPKHVATRPRTAGVMTTSNVAGVEVPTHHTSSVLNPSQQALAKPESQPPKEKRKTRLLNPMAMFSRRKSSQEETTQSTQTLQAARAAQLASAHAHAQALQQQRNIAALGVSRLPEDFDPRIRGKGVHDFSAPRPSPTIGPGGGRTFSHNDAVLDPWGQKNRELQTNNNTPFFAMFRQPPGGQSEQDDERERSTSPPRRTAHTPMFREHLNDSFDAATLSAESRENKKFLQRASQVSAISQESAILPPFARRSQAVDSKQPGYLHDEDALNRHSDVFRTRDRDSHMSSASSGISPITQRSSTAMHSDVRQSVSPISPVSPEKHTRTTSEMSRFAPSSVTSDDGSGGARPTSEASHIDRDSTSKSLLAHQRSFEPIEEEASPEKTPRLGDGFVPLPAGAVPQDRLPQGNGFPFNTPPSAAAGRGIPPRVGSAGSSPSIPSPLPTPEEAPATGSARSSRKLVQKRSNAVGHTKRLSANGMRHHVSNASRFSFQFGGSATEEQLLEEKGRKMATEGPSPNQRGSTLGLDEDDDYFDEDAMDDMDEMEMQGEMFQNGRGSGVSAASGDFTFLAAGSLTTTNLGDWRQQMSVSHGEGEDDGHDGSDEEEPYWTHDALQSYTHTRDPSAVSNVGPVGGLTVNTVSSRPRTASGASMLTVDTNVGPNARTGFYLQPQAAGYSPDLRHQVQRDSRGSEQKRASSGLAYGAGSNAMHKNNISQSTMGSVSPVDNTSERTSFIRGTANTSVSPQLPTFSNGLGLSGFEDFKFNESPEASRPMSLEAMQNRSFDARRQDSETIPQGPWLGDQNDAQSAAYHGRFGKAFGSKQSSPAPQQQPFSSPNDVNNLDMDDELYFDDGGFEGDVNDRSNDGEGMDENAFDDDSFLNRPNGAYHNVRSHKPDVHRREFSNDTVTGLGGDAGPYPSFAVPNAANAAKARARDSQLLLEDLPLQEEVDPKLIPRRNPSEDAKRLGLSGRVPPLPAQQDMTQADALKMQARLQMYHAALADAANKAFDDGRFVRQGSTSTSRSLSVYSKQEGEEKNMVSRDDRSFYSRNEEGEEEHPLPNGNGLLVRNESTHSKMDRSRNYTPPKSAGFDFGFDDALADDGFDDGFDEDDIISAANAEALASDDDGFYGQEFGFYANARPNSNEVQPVNGGFFGLDGDDGLARQKSLKEPNLTPITERSEFSTRNSFIGLGQFGPASAGGYSQFSPASKLPLSPWENEAMTFDQLRKLRATTFGGSNASLHSEKGQSPTISARSSGLPAGYFLGGGYGTDSANSSNPTSAHPHSAVQYQDSPIAMSATSNGNGNGQLPFSMSIDHDATPKRQSGLQNGPHSPMTARKVSDPPYRGHSRTSSGADSVTYVREQDPDGHGPPRWVLEKRRTSEHGLSELVAREVVQDGWI